MTGRSDSAESPGIPGDRAGLNSRLPPLEAPGLPWPSETEPLSLHGSHRTHVPSYHLPGVPLARPPPVLITNVFPDSVLESSVLSPIRLGPSDCWQPQTSDLAHRAAGAKAGRERGGPGDPDPWSPLLPSLTPDSFAALAPAPAPVPPPRPRPRPHPSPRPVPAPSPAPPPTPGRPRPGPASPAVELAHAV